MGKKEYYALFAYNKKDSRIVKITVDDCFVKVKYNLSY